MFGVTFGPEAVADFVSGPGEAAEMEVFVGSGELGPGFEVALFEETFDEGVSVEKKGGVFLEGKLGLKRGGTGTKGGQEKEGEFVHTARVNNSKSSGMHQGWDVKKM